jgi:hypothetical protein
VKAVHFLFVPLGIFDSQRVINSRDVPPAAGQRGAWLMSRLSGRLQSMYDSFSLSVCLWVTF